MVGRGEMVRTMRTGAKRLRMIAARETDPKVIAELTEFAKELDAYASELERSAVSEQRSSPSDGAS